VWRGVEIHQPLKLGGNGGRIDGHRLHLAPSRSRSNETPVSFLRAVNFRSGRRR
jgi:hypothetical protein